MIQYHKINTTFKRNMEGDKKLIVGDWSSKEFDFFQNCPWTFTEKIDGTNIRVIVDTAGKNLVYKGKSDNAVIPGPLLQHLKDKFEPLKEKLFQAFDCGACIYGEGYGGKIQGMSNAYGPDQKFIMFDILICDMWLERGDVQQIGDAYGIPVVPVIGEGTLMEAVEWAKRGIESTFGPFQAEGIVARPRIELKDKRGNRIIAKIKCRDFDNSVIKEF